jgi:hypothetical protein
MKFKLINIALLAATLTAIITVSYAFNFISFSPKNAAGSEHINCTPERHVCVMKTIFGLDDNPLPLKPISIVELPAEVKSSITNGLSWITKAQLQGGGWGAGMHSRQDIRDPHMVPADPATTALVAMSLLRTGTSLTSGMYQNELQKATIYLLSAVEQWPGNKLSLSAISGTQPQQKLGQNIDAILTIQYLTTVLNSHRQHEWKARIEKALQKCIGRIEKEQDTDGGWKGGGWAAVLQSALADHALESAQDAGLIVNSNVMNKSKSYQIGNFDTATNSAVTGKAAGVMLYSLSGTTRSSAKVARKAKDLLESGKKTGKVRSEEKLEEATLIKAGATPSEAKQLLTAYMINENTKSQSSREDIMEGFGSNGGEELISYLMTGESVIMQGGANEWKQWYDNMSKKILTIQKADGSWEGHHCITSPVFCTAAALLILSVNNDLKAPIK